MLNTGNAGPVSESKWIEDQPYQGTVQPVVCEPEKRNILAIDGGGVRCVIAMEALCTLENAIQKVYGDTSRVLSDEFDLVAGTSAGGMLASAIAIGMPMSEMRVFIENNIRRWFAPMPWYKRHMSLYDKSQLAAALQEGLGKRTLLGSERLKTELLLMTHNWSEDTEWLLVNRRGASPDGDLQDHHLELPLWQAALASASAPGYFQPEMINYGSDSPRKVVLQDGGMTGFLNPAFRAFRYATNDVNGPQWKTGQQYLNVVSIGSGDATYLRNPLSSKKRHLMRTMLDIPNALLQCSVRDQEALCRHFGVSQSLDMSQDTPASGYAGEEYNKADHRTKKQNMFKYYRINPNLESHRLAAMGFYNVSAGKIMAMDKPENYHVLSAVGKKVLESSNFERIANACYKKKSTSMNSAYCY